MEIREEIFPGSVRKIPILGEETLFNFRKSNLPWRDRRRTVIDKIIYRNVKKTSKGRQLLVGGLTVLCFVSCNSGAGYVEPPGKIFLGPVSYTHLAVYKRQTYNFPQGRVTDHRIKLTLHKLDSVLNGDLDEIIDSLTAADQAAKLANMNENE